MSSSSPEWQAMSKLVSQVYAKADAGKIRNFMIFASHYYFTCRFNLYDAHYFSLHLYLNLNLCLIISPIIPNNQHMHLIPIHTHHHRTIPRASRLESPRPLRLSPSHQKTHGPRSHQKETQRTKIQIYTRCRRRCTFNLEELYDLQCRWE